MRTELIKKPKSNNFKKWEDKDLSEVHVIWHATRSYFPCTRQLFTNEFFVFPWKTENCQRQYVNWIAFFLVSDYSCILKKGRSWDYSPC